MLYLGGGSYRLCGRTRSVRRYAGFHQTGELRIVSVCVYGSRKINGQLVRNNPDETPGPGKRNRLRQLPTSHDSCRLRRSEFDPTYRAALLRAPPGVLQNKKFFRPITNVNAGR